MGYVAHIRGRGEERRECERNPQFNARRWVVEVCHSWLNRFKKLLVRYEKKMVVKDHRHSRWLEEAPLKGAKNLVRLVLLLQASLDSVCTPGSVSRPILPY